MRIFEIILFEYILGYILQGFAYCLGIYAFCVRKLEISKYLIVSAIFIVISYVMRLIPVSFGVHTILNLICLFLLSIFYLKMPAFATIRSLLAITVLLVMTELLSVTFFTYVLGQAQFEAMMGDRVNKAILALPSSVIFAVLISITYKVLMKLKKKKSEKHGEGSASAL